MASTTPYALTIDQDSKRHVFKGTGHFDMDWLTTGLLMFKEHQVVIRQLNIYPDFRHYSSQKPTDCGQCLSMSFDAPKQDAAAFFNQLSKHLALITWIV